MKTIVYLLTILVPVINFAQNSKYENKWIPIKIYQYRLDDLSESMANLTSAISGDEWTFYNKQEERILETKFIYVRTFNEGLAAVAKEDENKKRKNLFMPNYLWGFIDVDGNQVVSCKYEDCYDYHEGIALVKQNGKWGAIDNTGKEIIACKYDNLISNSEGLIVACMNDKWGIIDYAGKIVVPFEYANIYSLSEGLYFVNNKDFFGFIDKKGNKVYQIPDEYVSVKTKISEGLIAVQSNSTEKWGYINKNSQLVIPCQYDDVNSFSEGLAFVKKDNKWGVIDKTGKIVVPFKYDGPMNSQFSEGLAPVVINNKMGYIDKTGREVIPVHFDYNIYSERMLGQNILFKNGLAKVFYADTTIDKTGMLGNYFYIDNEGKEYVMKSKNQLKSKFGIISVHKTIYGIVYANNKYGVCNLVTSKIIIPIIYDRIDALNDMFKVKQNNKTALFDNKGNQIVPFKYNNIFERDSEGYIKVETNGKYGIINSNNKEIIPPIKYESIGNKEVTYDIQKKKYVIKYFVEGYLPVKKIKWGFVDTNNKEVVPLIYDSVKIFSDGMAAVKKNNKWGYVDNTGKEVISCMYDMAYNFNKNVAEVVLNGEKKKIDKMGNIKNNYEYIGLYVNGLAPAKLNGKWGIIDVNENQVVEFVYDEIKPYRNNYAPFKKNNLWGVFDEKGQVLVEPKFTDIKEEQRYDEYGDTYMVNVLGRWIALPYYIDNFVKKKDNQSSPPQRPPIRRQ